MSEDREVGALDSLCHGNDDLGMSRALRQFPCDRRRVVAAGVGIGGNGWVLELLKTHFGYDAFLPLQEDIVGSVMAGRDTFALMPTGGGKSLCYQLPAMALPGLTLVVSPLIALMKDQVDALEANGVPAGFINSTQTNAELSQVVRQVRSGEIKLLYVAPERAIEARFADFLGTLNVSLVAIDEAHCVSEWGHDFRPAYRELRNLRRSCPDAPVIGLTATATRQVRADILSQLGLREPRTFISSFNRPNLSYSIVPKERDLSGLLSLLEKYRGESAIIYCGSRKDTEEMAQTLTDRGFKAEPYHAGLNADVRRATQERFIRDRTPIVVATIAFGMGIDKPDVRLVVHYDLPKSIESYYQETGRAGRDGEPGECVLFYSYAGKSKQEYFVNQIEDAEERERARQRLNQVISLCTLNSCRRRFVLQYLGEEWPDENCGACDNCVGPREQYEATEITQKVLSAVIRTGERFGAAHVIDVLRGSKGERILKQGHDQLSVHGIAADSPRDELRDLVEELKREGMLATSDAEFPTLSVTQKGRQFLRNRETLILSRPVERKAPSESRGERTRDPDGGAYDQGLYSALSALRRQIADERGVPAFVVFGNRTLQDMARIVPRTPTEFSRVSGVGRAKLEDLGAPFLECINAFARQQGWPETAAIAKKATPAERAPRVVNQSYRETGQIISDGASLEEAASERGLTAGTILGHLERLVEEGVEVEWAHLLPPEEGRAEIESVLEILGDNPMRLVWEELEGRYSYDAIRLVRLARRSAGGSQGKPSSSSADPRSMLGLRRGG